MADRTKNYRVHDDFDMAGLHDMSESIICSVINTDAMSRVVCIRPRHEHVQ